MQRLQSLGGILGKFKEIAAELGLIYAAAIWGATFYMVKGAITAVNPIALVGYRFLTASFILGAILFILKKDIFSKFKNDTKALITMSAFLCSHTFILPIFKVFYR